MIFRLKNWPEADVYREKASRTGVEAVVDAVAVVDCYTTVEADSNVAELIRYLYAVMNDICHYDACDNEGKLVVR